MPRKNKKSNVKRISITNFSTCRSKRKFNNENEASRAADMQNLLDMNLNISVYKCDICNGWHLTRD